MTISDVSPISEESTVYDVSQTDVSQEQDTTVASGISSMAELQRKAAPLYKAIMESIAYKICNDQKDSVDRIKQILDEAARNRK